jgi:hypothetical protein
MRMQAVIAAAYALGRWASGGYWGRGGYWGGSRINWAGGGINVNRGAHVEHWQHNPAHRGGARTMQTCSRGLVAPIARAPASPPAPASAPVLPLDKSWGPARRGPMSPIALDAQAARRTLVIARLWAGRRVPGA